MNKYCSNSTLCLPGQKGDPGISGQPGVKGNFTTLKVNVTDILKAKETVVYHHLSINYRKPLTSHVLRNNMKKCLNTIKKARCY